MNTQRTLTICSTLALALALTACSSDPESADDTGSSDVNSDATSDASTDSDVEPGDTADTDPGDTEPADTDPGDTEPTDTDPRDTEPTDTDPGDTEPTDTDTGDTEPTDTDPGDTEPEDTFDTSDTTEDTDTSTDTDTSEPPVEWPAYGGVEVPSLPIHTDMAEPGYLDWQIELRTAPPYFTDGRVQTEIARITDAGTFGISSDAVFLTQYAKINPWNADNSLMVVFYNEPGNPIRAALLDGQTFEFIRLAPEITASGRWSISDPNVYYRPASHDEARFIQADVRTGEITTFVDFADEGYVDRTNGNLFGGEGNQSNDDRYWAFNLQRDDGQWQIVIWDAETDTITGTIDTPGTVGPGGGVMDWWTVSQLGGFVVTQSHSAWQSGDIDVPRGNTVWSLTGEYVGTNDVSLGHLDVCVDADGNEVLGFMGPKFGGNDKVIQTWRLDGTAGDETAVHGIGYIGWTYHINCRATSRPGHLVLASSLSTPVTDYNRFPMYNHIFSVRLDESGEAGVIANAHHAEDGDETNRYFRAPFAPSNRDLSAVLFVAEWDESTNENIQIFVARPALGD